MGLINILLTDSGKSLVLDEDRQIDWVQENMFFEDDVELRGKYSFSFEIDRTANSDALDFVDVIQQTGRTLRYACVILIGGNKFYKGQVNILDWTDSSINIAVTRETVIMDTSQYIDEMDLGTYNDIANYVSRNADFNKVYPEVDYAWPQIMNFDEDMSKKYGTGGAPKSIINWQNGNTEAAIGTELMCPQFYFVAVLKKIIEALGLQMKSDIETDADLNNKLIFNPITPINANVESFKLVSFVRTLPRSVVYDEDVANFSVTAGTNVVMDVYEYDDYGPVNMYRFGHTITGPEVAGGYAGVMAGIRASFIANVTNSTLVSENYSDPNKPGFVVEFTTGNNMVIVSGGAGFPEILNGRIFPFNSIYVSFSGTLPYDVDVQMCKHLPHITVSDFFNSCRKFFNLAIILDELAEVIIVKRRKNMIDRYDKPHYIPLNVTEGAPISAPNYFILFDQDKDNDVFSEFESDHANNYAEHLLLPRTDIDTNAGTLVTDTLYNSASGTANYCKISMAIGDYTNNVHFTLRFINNEGVQSDSNGKDYIQSSVTGLSPNEIYTIHYKDWYDVIKKFTKAPIFYFDFGKQELQQPLTGVWQVDKIDAMWKRITTPINNNKGFLSSKVEGFK